eukprot:gene6450-8872_t
MSGKFTTYEFPLMQLVLMVEDVVLTIIQYVNSPKDLYNCSLTCRSWFTTIHKFSHNFRLWHLSYLHCMNCDPRHFYNSIIDSYKSLDWYQKAKDISLFQKNSDPFKLEDLSSDIGVHFNRRRAGHTSDIVSLSSMDTHSILNFIVTFGGATTSFDFINSFQVMVTDSPILECAAHVTGSLVARWLHSSLAFGSNIIYFGGHSNYDGTLNDFSVACVSYNGTKKSSLKPFNEYHDLNIEIKTVKVEIEAGLSIPSLEGHSFVWINEGLLGSGPRRAILFGGKSGDGHCNNDVYFVDISSTPNGEEDNINGTKIDYNCPNIFSSRWIKLNYNGTHPSPRFCHSAAMVPLTNNMIVFGGWDYKVIPFDINRTGSGQVFWNDLYVFNTESLFWTRFDSPFAPSPRCQFTLLHIPPMILKNNTESLGYMIVFGGASHDQTLPHALAQPYGSYVIDIADFHVLDVDTMLWLPNKYEFSPSYGGGVQSSVSVKPGEYIITGGMNTPHGSNINLFLKDVLLFHPRIGLRC